ncbi:MAG: PIN domain-containing protein [Bifidobacteriaceae bacterium]|nr:PIN domain-containing protein [Bifidobacteriaceae bacterium]
MIVLDACVLIAFADRDDEHHGAAAAILATPRALAVSALTGAEVMVHPQAAAATAWRQVFHDLGVSVLPLVEADMAALADVRRRTRLTMPDAIVVYLAQREGAGLASFDPRLLRVAAALGLPTYSAD